jgi:outer membrane lipoprotein-sorting protein
MLLVLVCLSAVPARGATTADAVLAKLEKANEAVKDLRAKLTYTRAIPLLDEKQTCEGTLAYLKPDRMVLKLGKPREEEIYTDGESWWVVSHRDKQVEHYKVADDQKAAQEASFLEFGLGSDTAKLKESYRITLSDEKQKGDETRWTLKLVPKLDGGPSRFSKIEVVVSSEGNLPVEIRLSESDGEIEHRFELADVKQNVGLKEEDLKLEMPRGYAEVRVE